MSRTAIDWDLFCLQSFGLNSNCSFRIPQDIILTDNFEMLSCELLLSYKELGVVFVINALKECWVFVKSEYNQPLEYYKKLRNWKDLGAIFNSGKYLLLCYDGTENFQLSKYVVVKR